MQHHIMPTVAFAVMLACAPATWAASRHRTPEHAPGEPAAPPAQRDLPERYSETPSVHAERPGKHSTTTGRHGTSGDVGGGENFQSGAPGEQPARDVPAVQTDPPAR